MRGKWSNPLVWSKDSIIASYFNKCIAYNNDHNYLLLCIVVCSVLCDLHILSLINFDKINLDPQNEGHSSGPAQVTNLT